MWMNLVFMNMKQQHRSQRFSSQRCTHAFNSNKLSAGPHFCLFWRGIKKKNLPTLSHWRGLELKKSLWNGKVKPQHIFTWTTARGLRHGPKLMLNVGRGFQFLFMDFISLSKAHSGWQSGSQITKGNRGKEEFLGIIMARTLLVCYPAPQTKPSIKPPLTNFHLRSLC